MADLAVLQETLHVDFNQVSLLEEALVHTSYLNEHPGGASNERLEFLGDAVLGLVIAEKLYIDHPDLPEGELTRLRAELVRRETLAQAAEAIDLGEYLRLGRGEEASRGRHKPANLAGALEAVIAAVYFDRGAEAARDLTLRLLGEELKDITVGTTGADYKSRLQEYLQSTSRLTPTYRLVEATGPDHDRRFTVEVLAGEKVLGRGSGKSKKLAEMEAARQALEQLPPDFTR